MHQDNVVIGMPRLAVDEVEDLARRLLDAVQSLWGAGRLDGLIASDVGRSAFQGFLSAAADLMTQIYEAERAGSGEVTLTLRLARTGAADVVAFVRTIFGLVADEPTMQLVGDKPIEPEPMAVLHDLLHHVEKRLIDSL